LPAYENFKREVQFENVNISYENFTLADVNLVFEKGKKYAIIGHSGSGKSSIINSITKSINLDSGKVRIDGMDIDGVDTSSIIACVNQFEYLFSSNLHE